MMIKPMTRPHISPWFRYLLHSLVLRLHVGVSAYPGQPASPTDLYRPAQWQAIAQRLRHGVALFAPDILEDDDLENLIQEISTQKKDHAFGNLEDAIPKSLASLICSEACHDSKEKAMVERHGFSLARSNKEATSTKNGQAVDRSKTVYQNSTLNTDADHQGEISEVENGEINGGEKETMLNRRCDIIQLERCLKKLAYRLWFCAYMEPGAQRILRDLGPDSSLNMEAGEFELILTSRNSKAASNYTYVHMPTSKLVQIIAQSLAGRTLQSPNIMVLAVVAGGAIVGLNTNEHQPADSDPGHCIYIIPGSMECPTRRIREIYEAAPRAAHSYMPREDEEEVSHRHLTEITEPTNDWNDAYVSISANLIGDIGEIEGKVYPCMRHDDRHLSCQVNNLRAIDNASRLQILQGCFKKCVKSQLSADEARGVHLNYLSVLQGWTRFDRHDSKGAMTFDWSPWNGSLKLALAHKNVAVQRAILSMTEGPVMLQLGQCVHCACRAALNSRMELLLV